MESHREIAGWLRSAGSALRAGAAARRRGLRRAIRCRCGALAVSGTAGINPAARWLSAQAGYAAAVARQLASGQPLLGAEAIGRRLAICRVCPHYDRRGACRLCGCACGGRRSWLDKLAFGTARCPDVPPRVA